MEVSIAMATYNGSKYILDQLLSFENQTRLPNEIVISDDCSTDETVSLIKEFIESSQLKIILIENDRNLGYTQNFNRALSYVSGDLVFLSDQDDVWFPDKIEKIVSFSKENINKGLFCNDVELTDQNLKPTGYTKLETLRSNGLGIREHGMGCACAIRKDLLNFCLPIPPNVIGHDNWFNLFSEILDQRLFFPEVLQYYRRHDSSTSSIKSNKIEHIIRINLNFKSRIKSFIVGYENVMILESKMCSLLNDRFDLLIPYEQNSRIMEFVSLVNFRQNFYSLPKDLRRSWLFRLRFYLFFRTLLKKARWKDLHVHGLLKYVLISRIIE